MKNEGMRVDRTLGKRNGAEHHTNGHGSREIYADMSQQPPPLLALDLAAAGRSLAAVAELVRPVLYRAGFTAYADPAVELRLMDVQATTGEDRAFTLSVFCPTFETTIRYDYNEKCPRIHAVVVEGDREREEAGVDVAATVTA